MLDALLSGFSQTGGYGLALAAIAAAGSLFAAFRLLAMSALELALRGRPGPRDESGRARALDRGLDFLLLLAIAAFFLGFLGTFREPVGEEAPWFSAWMGFQVAVPLALLHAALTAWSGSLAARASNRSVTLRLAELAGDRSRTTKRKQVGKGFETAHP